MIHNSLCSTSKRLSEKRKLISFFVDATFGKYHTPRGTANRASNSLFSLAPLFPPLLILSQSRLCDEMGL